MCERAMPICRKNYIYNVWQICCLLLSSYIDSKRVHSSTDLTFRKKEKLQGTKKENSENFLESYFDFQL